MRINMNKTIFGENGRQDKDKIQSRENLQHLQQKRDYQRN